MAKKRAKAKESPFGESSRVELIEQHLQAFGTITAKNAWKFVYEELLWFDKSTGLVHLYESDKAQPGRSSWYNRSIAFTNKLSELFNVDRPGLKARIDRLFLACLERMVQSQQEATEPKPKPGVEPVRGSGVELAIDAVETAHQAAEAAKDFAPYAELVAEVTQLLIDKARLDKQAAEALAKEIVRRAEYHLTFGSNRQNVLGEGFEDVLRLLAMKVSNVPAEKIVVRRKASELAGFQAKPEQVRRIETPDLAIIESNSTKLLSTIKWSLRHDRQKQLTDELDCYVQLLSQKAFPDYVLITNEYDPGRLKNSSNLSSRGKEVDRIYHINPSLVVDVLSDVESSAADVRNLIEKGRLKSLEDFLNDLRRFA